MKELLNGNYEITQAEVNMFEVYFLNKKSDEELLEIILINKPIEELINLLTTKYYKDKPKTKDVNCITCGKAIYTHTSISKTEKIHLLEMGYQHKLHKSKWLFYDDIKVLTDTHWGSKNTKSTQLEHWGLIQTKSTLKKTNALEVDEVKQGSQRLTQKGIDFINGKLSVPETCFKLHSKPIGFSKNEIFFYSPNPKGKDLTLTEVELHYKLRKLEDNF